MATKKITTRQRFKIKRFLEKNKLPKKIIMLEIIRMIDSEDVECFFNKLTDDLGLNAKTTFSLICNLQEGFCKGACHTEDRLIPDHYELCKNCKNLFDTDCGGVYIECGGEDLDCIAEYYEMDFSDGQYPEGHFCDDDCFFRELKNGK